MKICASPLLVRQVSKRKNQVRKIARSERGRGISQSRLALLGIELDARQLRGCQARIVKAMAADRWVSDGNYGKFREIQLPRTTTLVWLDYSLPVCLLRLLRRTVIRTVTRKELWAGNRESFYRQFFSKRSIFLFLFRQHPQLRRHYWDMVHGEAGHLKVIRLGSPREARRLVRACAARSSCWAR